MTSSFVMKCLLTSYLIRKWAGVTVPNQNRIDVPTIVFQFDQFNYCQSVETDTFALVFSFNLSRRHTSFATLRSVLFAIILPLSSRILPPYIMNLQPTPLHCFDCCFFLRYMEMNPGFFRCYKLEQKRFPVYFEINTCIQMLCFWSTVNECGTYRATYGKCSELRCL